MDCHQFKPDMGCIFEAEENLNLTLWNYGNQHYLNSETILHPFSPFCYFLIWRFLTLGVYQSIPVFPPPQKWKLGKILFVKGSHLRQFLTGFNGFYRPVGCWREKRRIFLACCKSKSLKVKGFYCSTYSPLNYYNEPATLPDLIILSCSASQPPHFRLSLCLNKLYNLPNFSSIGKRHDSRIESDLVNEGSVRVI